VWWFKKRIHAENRSRWGVGILAGRGPEIALLYFRAAIFFYYGDRCRDDRLSVRSPGAHLHKAAPALAVLAQFLLGVQHRAWWVLYLAGLGLYLQGQQIAIDLAGVWRAPHQRNGGFHRHGAWEARREWDLSQRGAPGAFQPQAETAPRRPLPARPARGGETSRGADYFCRRFSAARPVQEVHYPAGADRRYSCTPTGIWPNITASLLMASFVPFLVYFLLSWARSYSAHVYLLIFEGEKSPGRQAGGLGRARRHGARVRHREFSLLGLLVEASPARCYLHPSSCPTGLIIAPMSGFLSLVPYIGTASGLSCPPVVAALPAFQGGRQCTYFLTVSVAMLHLLALNLLYPEIRRRSACTSTRSRSQWR